MKILPYGNNALLIQFSEEIDPGISKQVIALYHALKRTGQFKYLIPAYQSLTAAFDSDQLKFTEAQKLAEEHLAILSQEIYEPHHLVIPVCYEPEYAPDLEAVEQITKLTAKKVIELHCSTTYHVYMLGFLAGFPYLGSTPKALHCPRKKEPRAKVPAGSVGLAGMQTGIYPAEAPGGWQLIGRTPLALFNPEIMPPNFLHPGDLVEFRAISKDEFKLIKIKVEAGIYKPEYKHG